MLGGAQSVVASPWWASRRRDAIGWDCRVSPLPIWPVACATFPSYYYPPPPHLDASILLTEAQGREDRGTLSPPPLSMEQSGHCFLC